MATETSRPAPSFWIRYSGLVIILAALLELGTTLFIGTVLPEAFVPGTQDAAIVADIVITYLILGFVGVAALYIYYEQVLGLVGKVGLVSIAFGIVVGIATILVTGFAAGSLLNLALVFGGAGLLAVGLWRIPTVPRSAALLMGATPVAAVVSIVGFSRSAQSSLAVAGYLAVSLFWAGAWVVLGYHLWQQRPEIRPGS